MSTQAEMTRIGNLIKTQDNRCTDAPIFIVEERKRIYGIDPEYADDEIVWLDGLNGNEEASEEEAAKLEAKYQEDLEEPEGWTRTGYIDRWEFVTACFTEQGCKEFLRVDGHNHGVTRIYAAGSYRNAEWRAVRDYLIGLAELQAATRALVEGTP
jgi:hypothetical protein